MSLKKYLPLVLMLIVSFAHGGERVALVIGNDNYQHARKLRTAVSDASAVAATLKKLDFKVLPVTNASVEILLESLGKVAEMVKGADADLVYYAGHGIDAGGLNFLVPVDGKLERDVQLRTQTVSMDTREGNPDSRAAKFFERTCHTERS